MKSIIKLINKNKILSILILAFLIRIIATFISTIGGDGFDFLYNIKYLLLNGSLSQFKSNRGFLGEIIFSPFYWVGGEVLARTIMAIISSLVIIPLYMVIVKYFGKKEAELVCIIYAIFPAYIFYTVKFYMEPLISFFIIFGLYYYVCRDNKIKNVFKSSIFFGLAFLTKNSTIFFLIIPFVLFITKFEKKELKKIVVFFIFFLLVASPLLILNFKNTGTILRDDHPISNISIEKINFHSFGTIYKKFWGFDFNYEFLGGIYGKLFSIFMIGLLIPTIILIFGIVANLNNKVILSTFIATVATIFLLCLLTFPQSAIRVVLPIIPLLNIGWAYYILKIKRIWWLILTFILFTLFIFLIFLMLSGYNNRQIENQLKNVNELIDEGDIIIDDDYSVRYYYLFPSKAIAFYDLNITNNMTYDKFISILKEKNIDYVLKDNFFGYTFPERLFQDLQNDPCFEKKYQNEVRLIFKGNKKISLYKRIC